MKITYRIPTKDQYAFVELEVEGGEILGPDEVRGIYEGYAKAFKGESAGPGLPAKDFNDFLDGYISTGKPGAVDVWAGMSIEQKQVINEFKKSLARIKSKSN